MVKRLGIVTSSIDVGNEYKKQLLKIFDNSMDIVTYSFDMNTSEIISNVDVLLISTYSQYEVLKKYIDHNVEIVISTLTLSKKGYKLLKESKFEKKAALVNLSFEMCIETIATLYQLGFDDYELIPVYPNMDNVPELDTAITTAELSHVPNGTKNIIDLGHRVITKNTIVDIAIALDLEDKLVDKRVLNYFDQLASHNKGFEYFISKSKTTKNQFNTLLSIMNKGVIGFDNEGLVESYNENAKKFIGIPEEFMGKHIIDLLPVQVMEEYIRTRKQLINKLIEINNKLITLSIFPVSDIHGNNQSNEINGAYAILENFESQENKQNMLRLQLTNKGHVAKYTVENIIGESEAVQQVKKLVVRMGNSHSAVLITGESGTGKELIAQAIHNASPIKDKQFVAINCAALSPNLLESELFGYEAGAFTGASKGGKPGIFELAHNGTLFLDEIGEMPLDLQVRLLRVIQEQEVMRVGGSKIIKVNVRIIAATNKNLHEQVKERFFRKDLYYRLNVLPIHVPALRERGGDIGILMDYFISLGKCQFSCSSEVEKFLNDYPWEGNIRELRNCIEYFENIGRELVQMEDLPYHMKEIPVIRGEVHDQVEIEGLNAKESYVLNLFYSAFKDRKKLGRKSLSKLAFEDNMFLSEYDVRSILNSLKILGYINVEAGRGGSTISKLGIEQIKK
jgi:transcriptional regulator with PAS, ATPase and Fis domain